MDRHELDGGDAQVGQVLDDGGVDQSRVGPPQLGGDLGVEHGQPPHVGLVDDRLVVGVARRPVVAPVEEGADDHAAGHVGGGVLGVAGPGVEHVVGVQGGGGLHLPGDGLGVGVQEELGGVAAVAVVGVVGAGDPVAVVLPGVDRG